MNNNKENTNNTNIYLKIIAVVLMIKVLMKLTKELRDDQRCHHLLPNTLIELLHAPTEPFNMGTNMQMAMLHRVHYMSHSLNS